MKSFKILARSAENFAFSPKKSIISGAPRHHAGVFENFMHPPLSRGTPLSTFPPFLVAKSETPPISDFEIVEPPLKLGGVETMDSEIIRKDRCTQSGG